MSGSYRIVVMLGGPGAEREVSLRSGQSVAAALRSLGHEVTEIDPQDGNFSLPDETDAVFLALHGAYGEDGTIQQQLESSGIMQCKVLLQHSLVPAPPPPPPTPPIDLKSGTCDFSVTPAVCTTPSCPCPGPDESNLPMTGNYVRVTVYVPVTQLTPNLLAACGLDMTNRFVSNSTTFRHEL